MMIIKRSFVLLVVVMVVVQAFPGRATWAQKDFPLELCRVGAFSTEEDFMMGRGEPYDGDPYISDGDLLSVIGGQVCARNADLLRNFKVKADLGLDGVDILDIERRLVAFSTELDSPLGTFSAGDLLITPGIVIPNAALVFPFGIEYDIGLDELKFMGDTDRILRFVELAGETSPEKWLDGGLQEILKELGIDIWFSMEGTHRLEERFLLDGDLLSASGSVIATNADLFVAAVPAGIPRRGVDFGLDAFAVTRLAQRTQPLQIFFSTEILYDDSRATAAGLSFTDGDVLRLGGAVVVPNAFLTAAFHPRARFLGLDALWVGFPPPPRDPNIQTMCGDRVAANFDGGMAPVGGPGTGLHQLAVSATDTLRQPCGVYVPIDGYLPPSGVTRFRVAYREVSEAVPAVGTAPGIQTSWVLNDRDNIFAFCLPNSANKLSTDSDGWMDVADYLEAKTGGALTDFCANSGLRLAVWNTLSLPAGPSPGHDREDHYVIWLEWEDAGGVQREPFDHHIQLDNTLPKIAPYPDGLEVRLSDGSTVVPACGEAPSGTSQFQVWGQFDDRYYWNFRLFVEGGLPPTTATFGPHDYYDPDDGPPGLKNTDDTGTTPDSTTVYLRDIDMTALGASFVDCCYLLRLRVYDAAIRHSFNGQTANDNSGSYYSDAFITFAAAP